MISDLRVLIDFILRSRTILVSLIVILGERIIVSTTIYILSSGHGGWVLRLVERIIWIRILLLEIQTLVIRRALISLIKNITISTLSIGFDCCLLIFKENVGIVLNPWSLTLNLIIKWRKVKSSEVSVLQFGRILAHNLFLLLVKTCILINNDCLGNWFLRWIETEE